MSPAAARALELFGDSEDTSEFQKLAFNYYQAAGWAPQRTSFDVQSEGPGDYSGAQGLMQGFQGSSGGSGGSGESVASGEPGGATGEASGTPWWQKGLEYGTTALGLPSAARAIRSPGTALSEAAKGGKLMKGMGWLGAGMGAYGDLKGAVTGDQGYESDGFWGQMGEQGMTTLGNLGSAVSTGNPYAVIGAGASTAANVLANTGRAAGAVWDARSSGRDASRMAEKTVGKVQSGMQQGSKDWLDQQQVAGKGSHWYNPASWGSGDAESTTRKAWGGSKLKQLDEGLRSGQITQQDYDLGKKHLGTLLSKYDPSAGQQSEEYRGADTGFSEITKNMGKRETPKAPAISANAQGSSAASAAAAPRGVQ